MSGVGKLAAKILAPIPYFAYSALKNNRSAAVPSPAQAPVLQPPVRLPQIEDYQTDPYSLLGKRRGRGSTMLSKRKLKGGLEDDGGGLATEMSTTPPDYSGSLLG